MAGSSAGEGRHAGGDVSAHGWVYSSPPIPCRQDSPGAKPSPLPRFAYPPPLTHLHHDDPAPQSVVYATPRRDRSVISEDLRKAEIIINNRWGRPNRSF